MNQGREADGYWTRTDQVIKEGASGGHPRCCGEKMVAADDHGTFQCWKCRK